MHSGSSGFKLSGAFAEGEQSLFRTGQQTRQQGPGRRAEAAVVAPLSHNANWVAPASSAQASSARTELRSRSPGTVNSIMPPGKANGGHQQNMHHPVEMCGHRSDHKDESSQPVFVRALKFPADTGEHESEHSAVIVQTRNGVHSSMHNRGSSGEHAQQRPQHSPFQEHASLPPHHQQKRTAVGI